MHAVQTLVDSRLQITRKHGGHSGGRMEDTSPLAELARLVPSSENSMSGRVENRLGKSDEEPDDDNVVAGLCCRKRESQYRPHQLAARNPDGRADFREDNLTW